MGKFEEHYFSNMLKKGWLGKYTADKGMLNKCWVNFLKKSGVVSVLEIGCGVGFFGKYAIKCNLDYYGVDVSEFSVKKAVELHGSYFGNERITDIKKPFDCIIAFDVFEHIQHNDILEMFTNIYDALPENGLLIFTTPNPDSMSKKYRKNNWFAYADETHVNIQDKGYWRRLSLESGFVVVKESSDFPWDLRVDHLLVSVQKILIVALYKAWLLMFGPVSTHMLGDNLIYILKKTNGKLQVHE